MKKFIRIGIMVVIALLFIGTFVFLYQKSQPKDVEYNVLKVVKSNIVQTTVATGKIEPRDEVQIKPQISGIISEVYKEAGETVKKGEIIAKVKVIPELGQLNSAESRVRLAEMNGRQAETDLERMEKLYEKKLVSSEEYEKTLLTTQQAREEIQAAKDNLEIIKEGITKNSASFSSTLIRSTIDGLILDVPIKVGNSVIMSNTFNDGTTIATVAFNATLEYISPKSVENNGANQFEIKAAIAVPDSVTIRSGYSANAEMELQRASQVLSIPESALEFKGDSTFVFLLTDSVSGQKFERINITTGVSDGINVEVKSGLKESDLVRGLKKE